METVKGLMFTLTGAEMRELINRQADRCEAWLATANAFEMDEQKQFLYRWRVALLNLLRFGAEHVDDNASYELDRVELQSLFEEFGD